MQLGGQGQPLPLPAKTFPSSVVNGQRNGIAVPPSSNEIALPAGGMLLAPPGIWLVSSGVYSGWQWLDPVTGYWRPVRSTGGDRWAIINSDGTNYRVFNPLGTPVGALVTNVGSGYSQSNTTVTASGSGGSIWEAIVGGAVDQTVTVGNDPNGVLGGTNWTLAPIVIFDAPPAGGVPATGYGTVSAGAVSAITVVDQGAGYVSPPNGTLYPNPLDPNFGIITIPAVTTTLTGTGEIAAVLMVAPGAPLTSAPTLTISGSGSSATATAIMALTVASMTVASGTANSPIFSAGGLVTTAPGGILNPSISTGLYRPREFNGVVTGASAGVIIDGGMFQVAPTGYSPAGTITFTMGSVPDVILMQLMPGT